MWNSLRERIVAHFAFAFAGLTLHLSSPAARVALLGGAGLRHRFKRHGDSFAEASGAADRALAFAQYAIVLFEHRVRGRRSTAKAAGQRRARKHYKDASGHEYSILRVRVKRWPVRNQADIR